MVFPQSWRWILQVLSWIYECGRGFCIVDIDDIDNADAENDKTFCKAIHNCGGAFALSACRVILPPGSSAWDWYLGNKKADRNITQTIVMMMKVQKMILKTPSETDMAA